MDIPIVQPPNDEEVISDEALLFRYHRKFGHISFSRLQNIAKIGIIPKRLNKYRIPMFSMLICKINQKSMEWKISPNL